MDAVVGAVSPAVLFQNKEAFATAEHTDGNEQDLVTELRKGKAYIPELALIAQIDGNIPPEGFPAVNFMAIKLQEDAKPLNGTVVYAEQFGM